MAKNYLPIIFLFLSIFLINCRYKGNKLSLQEQFEVEDLALALFKTK